VTHGAHGGHGNLSSLIATLFPGTCRAVTAGMALRFERLGIATAGLLLRLQDDYDLAQQRASLGDKLAASEPVRDG
jgi:plasmid maintenance system antidote protein VapI